MGYFLDSPDDLCEEEESVEIEWPDIPTPKEEPEILPKTGFISISLILLLSVFHIYPYLFPFFRTYAKANTREYVTQLCKYKVCLMQYFIIINTMIIILQNRRNKSMIVFNY